MDRTLGASGQDQGQGARPECARHNPCNVGKIDVLCRSVGTGIMADQWIEAGSALGRKYGSHSLARRCIRCEAVNRFRRHGDQKACTQQCGGLSQALLVWH
jgi:hypothetical protein